MSTSRVAVALLALLGLAAPPRAQQFAEPVMLLDGPPRAIAVIDIDGSPRLDLVTANYDDDTLELLRAKPQGGYEPPELWPGGNGPSALAVADMNLDGQQDVLVISKLGSQLGVLMPSDGGQTLATWSYAFSGQPVALAAGDLDGDGDNDVVVAETQLNRIAVRLGLGRIGMGPVTTFATGQSPSAVRLQDLDGDGDLDAITANSLSRDVSTLLNDGAGGFGAPTNLSLGGAPIGLAVADFDGDTKPDVAVAVSAPAGVRLLLGDGSGALTAGPTLPLGHPPLGLLDADLGDDGRTDLVVPSYEVGFGVLMNAGAGAFLPVVEHMPGTIHSVAALADLDDDGRIDLVLDESQGAMVLSGDGAGGFREPAVVPFTPSLTLMTTGDADGDGRGDLIGSETLTGPITVRLADGLGGFGTPITSPITGYIRLLAADLDGDGMADLVTAGSTGIAQSGVAVSLGDGAGGFGPQANFALDWDFRDSAAADMDGDGDLDVLVLSEGSLFGTEWHYLSILPGDGAGQLGAEQSVIEYGIYGTFPTQPAFDRLAVGDIDGDGMTDVVVGDATDHLIRLFKGNGAGGLISAGTVSVSDYSGTKEHPLALADTDEDSDLDLVLRTNGGVKTCLGNGNGTFGAPTTLASLGSGTTIHVTDVDADGHVDLVADGAAGTYFVLLRGDGTGAFEAELYGTGGSSNRPVPWLLDGDALPDIVCLASSKAMVSLNLGLSSQWADLGYGLAGTNGVPQLVGSGTLQAGSPGTLKLSNANPNQLAVLVISKQSNPAPFKGGVLATVPPLISFMLVTSPAGAINLSWAHWPGGAPGSTWYFQYGVVDSGGPAGAALSNALRATVP